MCFQSSRFRGWSGLFLRSDRTAGRRCPHARVNLKQSSIFVKRGKTGLGAAEAAGYEFRGRPFGPFEKRREFNIKWFNN
jgi:hypothetical protein